jgi:hypothetical protein
MESCLVKSIMAGGMGFALGGAFGLFMSSVRVSPSHRLLCTCVFMFQLVLIILPDVLRHAPDAARSSDRQSTCS